MKNRNPKLEMYLLCMYALGFLFALCVLGLVLIDTAWAENNVNFVKIEPNNSALWFTQNSNGAQWYIVNSQGGQDIYFATIMTTGDNGDTPILAICFSSVSYSKFNANNGANRDMSTQIPNDTWYYGVWGFYDHISNITPANNTFSSVNDAIDAFVEYKNNGFVDPVPEPPLASQRSNVMVNPGNVVYFRKGSSTLAFSLSQTTSLYYGGNFGRKLSDINQYIGYADELPSENDSFPAYWMSKITWLKASNAPTNSLGQFNQLAFTDYYNGNYKYLVVYNPYYESYNGGENPNSVNVNSPIIFKGFISEFKSYSLNDAFNIVTQDYSSSSVDDYTNPIDGTVDSETGNVTMTDSQGNTVSEIPYGGNNIVPDNEEYKNIIETIKGIITQLIQKIEDIFDVGHSAIGTLYNAARGFIQQFGLLYAWMPQEVYSVIIAAIIIAVTIAIFKVFL